MKDLLKFLLAVAMMFVNTLFSAWVIMVIWNWFVPGIFGLSTLSYGLACGLEIIIMFIVKPMSELAVLETSYNGYGRVDGKEFDFQFKKNKFDLDTTKFFDKWMSGNIQSLLYLFIAWVLHGLLL